jgi:hypothetical protein
MKKRYCLLLVVLILVTNAAHAFEPREGIWKVKGNGTWPDMGKNDAAFILFEFLVSEDGLEIILTRDGVNDPYYVVVLTVGSFPGAWYQIFAGPDHLKTEIANGSFGWDNGPFSVEGQFDSETTAHGTWKDPQHIFMWGVIKPIDGTWTASYIGADCIKGDVNGDGDIGSNDAILALRIAAGLAEPTADQECAADANNDGKVTSADAILILRMAAGLDVPEG